MKKIFLTLLIVLSYSYVYASYYTESVDEYCTLDDYKNLEKYIKDCNVNSNIANSQVFLNKKFIGKNPTPLYLAVVFNDLKMVKKLVSKGAAINVINYFPESSPLMKAVENNNIEMVKYLLEQGADVNLTTPKYYLSAIDFASNYDMAVLLLSHNAKVDKINGFTYYTPLQNAILLNNVKMVEAYLPKSNINQKDYLFKKDALYYAVTSRNMDIIKLIVDAGAKISPKEYEVYKNMTSNKKILSMLSDIIDKDKKEFSLKNDVSAAILYEKIKSSGKLDIVNAIPDILDDIDDEYSSLLDPSTNNILVEREEVYRSLVKSLNLPKYEEATGFDLDGEDNEDYSDMTMRYYPISAAVEFNDTKLLQMLLDANHLKMQYPVKYFTNLFSIAVFTKNIEAIDLLMKYNYSPTPCAPPIYNNANGRYTDTIEYRCSDLLSDVLSNFSDEDKNSSEYKYYKKMYDKFVEYDEKVYRDFLNEYIRSEERDMYFDEDELLEMVKSKPVSLLNDTNDVGEGLLHIALENNFNRLASYLILNGFDIYDNYYFVPIKFAKDNKMLEQLLIMQENMYLGDELGIAFLQYVGDTEKLQLFIKYGLNINFRDRYDKPLLFHAIDSKNLESVKLIVEKGANLDDLYKGANILQYSKNFGTNAITSYLGQKIKEKKITLKDDELFNYLMKNKSSIQYQRFYEGYRKSADINELIHKKNYFDNNRQEQTDFEKRFITNNELTPLVYAIILNDEKLVKFLLDKGADPNQVADDTYSELRTTTVPLSLAFLTKNKKIIDMLLEKKATLPKKVLTMLVLGQNYNILEQYNIISPEDIPLVQASACLDDSKRLDIVLKNIDISNIKQWPNDTSEYFKSDVINKFDYNPLKCALDRYLENNVKVLLEHNINIKYKDFNGLLYISVIDNKNIQNMIKQYCEKNKEKCR